MERARTERRDVVTGVAGGVLAVAAALAAAWPAAAAGPVVRPLAARAAAAEAAAEAPPPAAPVAVKTETPAAQLLLPFYTVEAGAPGGVTTLLAVRNESLDDAVTATFRYYEADRPQVAIATEVRTIDPKAVVTINLRDKLGPLALPVDLDGFARGYVEVSGDAPTLQGDFFQVETSDAFASGERLVSIDLASTHYELCGRVASRYLNGGGFTSSRFRVWLEADAPPDTAVPVLFYSVYDEAGNLTFAGQVHHEAVAFEIDAATLVNVGPIQGPPFGVIEFEFNQTVGHVGAVMSAAGLYSVGVEGVCQDGV